MTTKTHIFNALFVVAVGLLVYRVTWAWFNRHYMDESGDADALVLLVSGAVLLAGWSVWRPRRNRAAWQAGWDAARVTFEKRE